MGIKSFISLLFFLSIAPSDRPSKTHPVTIPTQVVENMFYAHAVTNDGVELNFYTDSGGMALIWRRTVDQLHLTTIKVHAGDEDFEQVKLPAFLPGKGIPLPLGSDGKFVVNSDEKSLAILGDESPVCWGRTGLPTGSGPGIIQAGNYYGARKATCQMSAPNTAFNWVFPLIRENAERTSPESRPPLTAKLSIFFLIPARPRYLPTVQ